MGKSTATTISAVPIDPKALALVNCDSIEEFVDQVNDLTPDELRACVTDLAFALGHVRGKLAKRHIALELHTPEARA